jgi:hypothetical protein
LNRWECNPWYWEVVSIVASIAAVRTSVVSAPVATLVVVSPVADPGVVDGAWFVPDGLSWAVSGTSLICGCSPWPVTAVWAISPVAVFRSTGTPTIAVPGTISGSVITGAAVVPSRVSRAVVAWSVITRTAVVPAGVSGTVITRAVIAYSDNQHPLKITTIEQKRAYQVLGCSSQGSSQENLVQGFDLGDQ